MTDQLATEPDEGVPAPEPEVAPEAEELETQQAEAEGQEPDEGEDLDQSAEPVQPETVEIEIDGQKYSVPAALQDGYMQHADYTRKTQEIAAERKALEARHETLQQQAQMQQDHLADHGELSHTEKLLDQFRKVDWQQVQRDDPEQAQQLALQFQVLRDQREQIVERIQTRENEARVQAERENAARQDRLTATLAREIPNYSPKLREDLISVATEVGFDRQAVERATDPNVWKVLNLARLGQEVLKRQQSAAKPPPKEAVTPVPKAKGGRSPAAVSGPRDSMSTEDWMAAERKRLAKKRGAA